MEIEEMFPAGGVMIMMLPQNCLSYGSKRYTSHGSTLSSSCGARIGHIHLKVSDLDRAMSFYQDLLGFEVTERMGDSAVFLAAGGYHHHIGLNTWHSKDAAPAAINGVGLYHLAICYPTRKDLAEILFRLREARYPLSGTSDHGVSEALYLRDPDGNGVELYHDRPRIQWPKREDGTLHMFTHPLDLSDLLRELE